MNNKKSELQIVDDSFKKKIARIIAIIIDAFLAIGVINILSEWNTDSNDKLITNCITIGLFLIYTYVVVRKTFFKSSRKSMQIMKNFCSYNELSKFLENEKFKELKQSGEDSAYQSKLWLKLDGVFIPKNFIAGAYIDVATHGVYELRMILINGKMFYYRLGSDKNKIEGPLNAIKSAVPHLKLYNDVFGKNKDIFNKTASKYKDKSKDGINIESLISRWTGEFEIK